MVFQENRDGSRPKIIFDTEDSSLEITESDPRLKGLSDPILRILENYMETMELQRINNERVVNSEIGLHKRIVGYGLVTLKKLCGNLNLLVSTIRDFCEDQRIEVVVNTDRKEVVVHAPPQHMEASRGMVYNSLEFQKKLLDNKCFDMSLYFGGPQDSPPLVLCGAGAEIKHIETEKKFLSVLVQHSNVTELEDNELLKFLELVSACHICNVTKFVGSSIENEEDQWGKVTFMTPAGARNAASDLNPYNFGKGTLRVVPDKRIRDGDRYIVAGIYWPRMCSQGTAVIKCNESDVGFLIDDFCEIQIKGRFLRIEVETDRVILKGIDRDLDEQEIFEVLSGATTRPMLDFYVVREIAVENPVFTTCEERILQEIYPFMPNWKNQGNGVHVHILGPERTDKFMNAKVIFYGSLHLEAAKALDQINGKVLPGGLNWQKMHCNHIFQSSVSCAAPVYDVVKDQLGSLLRMLQQRTGVEYVLEKKPNDYYRVKISARSTQTVAESIALLEQLMKGKLIRHPAINPSVFQMLLSRRGELLLHSLQRETGTHIIFDEDSMTLTVYGSPESVVAAESYIVKELVSLHNRAHENYNRSFCAICLCELEDGYVLEGCGHEYCYLCLIAQCTASMGSRDGFPLICTTEGCGDPILLTDLISLLPGEKLEELFWASFSFCMDRSTTHRYCPSPDCLSIYRVAGPDEEPPESFLCDLCRLETCRKCHLPYHPGLSCDRNRMFLEDPDSSLHSWIEGKESVKACPRCSQLIEKGEGCNHMHCKCGTHFCWICLDRFASGHECYRHVQTVHGNIGGVVVENPVVQDLALPDVGDWEDLALPDLGGWEHLFWPEVDDWEDLIF